MIHDFSREHFLFRDNFVAVRIGFKSLSKRVEAYKPAVSWYGLIGNYFITLIFYRYRSGKTLGRYDVFF